MARLKLQSYFYELLNSTIIGKLHAYIIHIKGLYPLVNLKKSIFSNLRDILKK